MNVDEVAQRDEWRCWICGNEVDPNAVAGSAHAASVDHVVPRAEGGKSTKDNLRLAHRRCNTRRGSRIPELEWPTYESMVDCTPLWPAVKRLAKRPGEYEQVAFLADADEASAASVWAITAATALTGLGWTGEVVDLGRMHGVRLRTGK